MFAGADVAVAVLRPSVTVADEGSDELGRVLAAARVLAPADGASPAQFVHVARELARLGHRVVAGSPQTLADTMQEWIEQDAADGFTILFPYYPTPVEDFVDLLREQG